ncbi:LysR family transcriptional regulator [Streptomyces olivochromogenes]|uniref:LysR family transcriptional regulator n=1 Tax=Streptomyces olivochromogenes TaxID=1963 RepID=UPI003CC58902
MPQPTVSHAMRRVNDAIGTPLAHRVGRGILATPAGRAFLPAAREALAVLRAARLELADVVDPDRGQVSLGFLHTLGVVRPVRFWRACRRCGRPLGWYPLRCSPGLDGYG